MSTVAHEKQPLLAVLQRVRADKHCSSAYIGETATIEVGAGTNKQTFHVHRDLLSFYSDYFRAALNGSFAEARTGTIELETEEPAVLEGFVKWLYTQKFLQDKITEENNVEFFESVVKLWIFADRRGIPLLMNEMIDCLQQSIVEAWILPKLTITEIYNNTTEESGLRRMIVDTYASLAGDEQATGMMYDSDVYMQNFLIDLVKSLIAEDSRKPPLTQEQYEKVEMCPSFHVHEEGVQCKKKGTDMK